MVKVLLISPYDECFTRSKSGAIWGRIYFQIGDGEFFPEKGWTDLVVAFLRNWLEVVNGISEGHITREVVHFLDGPLEVDIAVTGPGLVELNFTHRGVLRHSASVNVKDVLKDALLVAEGLLGHCREKGWANQDTEALAALIAQVMAGGPC